MSTIALYTWMVTILAGLLLLVIWIIEYDREFHSAAATRLPIPVISAHALLGMAGLVVWIGYLLVDEKRLVWIALALLGAVAVLGLIMAVRWIGVYRATRDADQTHDPARDPARGPGPALPTKVPPERAFPVPVVIAHGLLAITTVGLVLLTALGVGASS